MARRHTRPIRGGFDPVLRGSRPARGVQPHASAGSAPSRLATAPARRTRSRDGRQLGWPGRSGSRRRVGAWARCSKISMVLSADAACTGAPGGVAQRLANGGKPHLTRANGAGRSAVAAQEQQAIPVGRQAAKRRGCQRPARRVARRRSRQGCLMSVRARCSTARTRPRDGCCTSRATRAALACSCSEPCPKSPATKAISREPAFCRALIAMVTADAIDRHMRERQYGAWVAAEEARAVAATGQRRPLFAPSAPEQYDPRRPGRPT
jgi:hypothetical protein